MEEQVVKPAKPRKERRNGSQNPDHAVCSSLAVLSVPFLTHSPLSLDSLRKGLRCVGCAHCLRAPWSSDFQLDLANQRHQQEMEGAWYLFSLLPLCTKLRVG